MLRPSSLLSQRHARYALPVIVAVAYYLGARVGFLLTPPQQSVSMLWPPNAILLGALLLAPTSAWPLMVAAVLPAHIAVELGSGVPMPMVLCWYVSNVAEAVLGAALMRRKAPGKVRFDDLHHINMFVVYGALAAPLATSFLDAGFVWLNRWGTTPFLEVIRIRFFSNVLAIFTIVPVIVMAGERPLADLRRITPRRALEALILVGALVTVSAVCFEFPEPSTYVAPTLLYVPLPFLLWAAIRFGPAETSGALLVVSTASIAGALSGRGPFAGDDVREQVLSLQVFLISTYIPMLVLASLLRERKNADRAVRNTNDQLRLALDAAQLGMWEVDPGRKWMKLSAESRAIFGVTTGEVPVPEMLARIDPRDHALVMDASQRAFDDGALYEAEFRLVAPETAPRWVLSKGQVLRDIHGNPTRMVGVHGDITERKLNEARRRREIALLESEARLRELADAMPQIVWSARPDGSIDYFNRKWYEFTGTDEEIISEHTWLSVMHPDDRLSCLHAWETSIRNGTPHEHQGRFRCAKGKYHWLLTRALPARTADGVIQRWYGTATNIDENKRVEEVLRESERQLRALGEELERRVAERTAELHASEERFAKAFRASPIAEAISRRRDGCFIEVNERWESMFSISRQDAIGRTITDLGVFPNPDDRARIASDLATLGFVHELELELSDRHGDVLRGVVACEMFELGGETCLITMIRDITESRRVEHEVAEQRRQLAHLGRVAVLGELSSAIAHELNQPLTSILANARAAQRMLQRERVDHRELYEILGDIASDDLRAGAVIHRVRALLRRGDADPQLLDINEIITEVLELTHSDLIQRGVTVMPYLADSMLLILGDRVQLQQVLLNLIFNGCEAMADSPRSDRILTIKTTVEGDAVMLTVSDRGTGIANAVLDSVFDAFVTSKPHGLGLGLSICRSIVNAHGGKMWAMNNPGRGATFSVSIPQGAAMTLAPSATRRASHTAAR